MECQKGIQLRSKKSLILVKRNRFRPPRTPGRQKVKKTPGKMVFFFFFFCRISTSSVSESWESQC